MNTHTRSGVSSRTVTQISEDEYLVEGETEYGRLGFEIDPSMLTFADFENGPFIHVGFDFFGKGLVKNIQSIDSGRDGYMMIKVKIDNKN